MPGRLLQLNLLNIGLEDKFKEALGNLGFDLNALYKEEKEQGLGMAGLGQFSYCCLESLSTLEKPAIGYGIRYSYGSFEQRVNALGHQIEVPDFWQSRGNPWEIPR
jgi:starch phosphorylase